uniref:Uncharacterized protein n=1 Tax=Lygus hesperus TaxID=30085 RepID=A0A0A9X881_LYGHE
MVQIPRAHSVHYFNPLQQHFALGGTVGLECEKINGNIFYRNQQVEQPLTAHIDTSEPRTHEVEACGDTCASRQVVVNLAEQDFAPLTVLCTVLYGTTPPHRPADVCEVVLLSQLRGYYSLLQRSSTNSIVQSNFVEANYLQNLGSIQRLYVTVDAVPETAFVYTANMVRSTMAVHGGRGDDVYFLLVCFFTRVLPHTSNAHGIIKHSELHTVLYGMQTGAGRKKIPPFFLSDTFTQSLSCHGERVVLPRDGQTLTRYLPTDPNQAVHTLIRLQLLQRYTGETFTLAVPALSQLILDVRATRREMLTLLHKQLNREMWLDLLLQHLRGRKFRWKHSHRHYSFHLYDILGAHSFSHTCVHNRILLRPTYHRCGSSSSSADVS